MASAQDPFQRKVQSTTERYIAPCGIEIFTYVGDINAVPDATAAVTGEGKKFADKSFITQSLIETCPGLQRTRDELKKKYGKFKSWTVRTSKLDHESKFRFIFHAVLGRRKDEYWVEGMKKLYEALFKKAEKYEVTTLALPLLGSGRAGAVIGEAVQAVTESITLMPKYHYLNKIYLVTLDKQNADEMAVLCQKNFLNPSEVQSRLRRSLRYRMGFGGSKYRKSRKKKDNKRANSQDQSYLNLSTQNAQVNHQQGSSQSKSTQNAEVNKQHSYQEYKSMHTVQGQKQQSQPPQNVKEQTQKAFEGDHHLSPQMENAQIQRKGGRETAQLTVGKKVKENIKRSEGGFDPKYIKRSDQTRYDAEAEGINDIQRRYTRENHIPKSRRGDRAPSHRADNVFQTESNGNYVDDTPADNEYGREDKNQARRKNPNYGETENRRVKETNAESRVFKNEDEHRRERRDDVLEVRKKNVPHHQSLSINCPICLNQVEDPKRLGKCGHVFCRTCIERSFSDFKPVCPSCNMVYGEIRGNQPDGQMDVGFSGEHLPGFEGHGTITITYYFPSGTQGEDHPNPGEPYKGTTRRAYLPDCKEGKAILKLLRKAFDRRLIFTIGRSTTTGQENVVTWNDVHHKTNKDGGPTRFGYPDPGYLTRVKDELAAKGVKEERQGKMETTF